MSLYWIRILTSIHSHVCKQTDCAFCLFCGFYIRLAAFAFCHCHIKQDAGWLPRWFNVVFKVKQWHSRSGTWAVQWRCKVNRPVGFQQMFNTIRNVDKVLQQAAQLCGVLARIVVLLPVTHRPCRRCFQLSGDQIYLSKRAPKIRFYEYVQNGIECSKIMPTFTQQSTLTFGTDTFSMCGKREEERHDSSLEVMAKVAATHIWSCSGLRRDESRDTQVVCTIFSSPSVP